MEATEWVSQFVQQYPSDLPSCLPYRSGSFTDHSVPVLVCTCLCRWEAAGEDD
uniref:Uncharacterized protein n=1 Tax=Anguilla anguilla TaxID=7936 RepID=A0A0E9PXG3_ANGAN